MPMLSTLIGALITPQGNSFTVSIPDLAVTSPLEGTADAGDTWSITLSCNRWVRFHLLASSDPGFALEGSVLTLEAPDTAGDVQCDLVARDVTGRSVTFSLVVHVAAPVGKLDFSNPNNSGLI